MKENQVGKLRIKIDHIDNQIVTLLDQRILVAHEIMSLKESNNTSLLDPSREKQIVDRLKKEAKQIPDSSLKKIFYELFSISRNLSKELMIAFLGPETTFSHLAARNRFGSHVDFVTCRTIEDVFEEVEKNRADYGVVPIENSSQGAVIDTLSKLFYTDLNVIGEIYIPIQHCLLSRHPLNEIKKLYSHRQPLTQCRDWILKNLNHAEIIETSSSAQAAEQASLYHHSAAIGSRLAAKKYDLNTVIEGIEDIKDNTTRFLILGPDPVKKGSKSKTLIIFSTEHKSGSLYNILGSFAENNVSMTMIESKRTREQQWRYIFYVDMEGHQEDPNVQKALEELKEKTSLLKILGSYPTE